uniref:Uncharacterized protein n=1 Tax=Pongo abelii TaxID=9601 RepID=H2NM68_PONAB
MERGLPRLALGCGEAENSCSYKQVHSQDKDKEPNSACLLHFFIFANQISHFHPQRDLIKEQRKTSNKIPSIWKEKETSGVTLIMLIS